MLPTLRPGQLVIGWRPYRQLRTECVVIITHNGLDKIKRITDIDNGYLYFLGDNSMLSTDSRHFGKLPTSAVLALVIWPGGR